MRFLFSLLFFMSVLVKAGAMPCAWSSVESMCKEIIGREGVCRKFEKRVSKVNDDSISHTKTDSLVGQVRERFEKVDTGIVKDVKKDLADLTTLKPFSPSPKRALWLAIAVPGAGQIYNRKYWKLPIFYGGFLGCTYALMWNQQMYKDYSKAYLDIMDNDPTTASYKHILPPRYQIEGMEEQFKTIFKNKKDYYRRYRDLSAFAFVGVYLLSIIDAYVDASLSDFDISPDLSLQVQPAAIQQENLSKRQSAYGLGCSLRF